MAEVVEVMDTTLRDGEQMRDGSFTAEEKLSIARMLLEDVQVDRIEVASARVSQGELEAVTRIVTWARECGLEGRVEVLGFTDIKQSVDWMHVAGARVVNLLTKGSVEHLTKQLRKTPEQHVSDIRDTLDYAASKGLEANIYLEVWSNGMKESPDYVHFLLEGLAGAPVRRFMLPDTLGILHPAEVREYVCALVQRYPSLHFDFHGHNDYGLATANSLAAVAAGARGVHCTVNGLGERAGNTALDEVVVAIHDFAGRRTGVNEAMLCSVSQTVEIFSGRRMPVNKPISGQNVFTQTAGIHADGDMKANLYASRLAPERFGRKRQYALGKLSGRSNLDYNLEALGIQLTVEQKKRVLERVIALGDMKTSITQEDLPYIISDVLEQPAERRFELRSCVVVSSTGVKPMATVKLAHRADPGQAFQEYEESALGDGGYDALMNAIRKITDRLGFECPTLVDYQINIPSGGQTDALVQCFITWRGKSTFVTRGVNSDQVLAAAEATEKMLNTASAVGV
jgi:D-citramalate synthase